MSETNAAITGANAAHFGGANNTNAYVTGGFTLGYAEAANNNYRKVGIFSQGRGSGTINQNLLLCVRTNTDSLSCLAGDAKISIAGDNGVASGDFNDTCDVGFKENITDISGSLALVKQLKPRLFTWKGPKAERGDSTGFIAQEVEQVIPLLVCGNDVGSTTTSEDVLDENGDLLSAATESEDTIGKSINTIGLVAHLTKAIQELEARIATLEG